VSGLVKIPVEVAADAVVFDVVPRGYARRQVDAHVAAQEQELAELRWEHDELAAERRALQEQREEQQRWVPTFEALGARVVELLRLAEQEAAELRAEAARDVQRQRAQAVGHLVAQREAEARALEQARREAERELRTMTAAAEHTRELLEAELARVRRDAELEVAGRLAQASAQAADLVAEAERQAEALRASARAEVAQLQRRRDTLAGEMVDLSARLVAVVHRLDRTDAPLDVSTA
jgi:chromosome segregation ATPase